MLPKPELSPQAMPTSGVETTMADLIGPLSFAIDVSLAQEHGHSLQTCWIGYRIGQAAGLSPERLATLYCTLLLKDLNKCMITPPLDRSARHVAQTQKADGSSDHRMPLALQCAFGRTGLKGALSEEFRHAMQNLHRGIALNAQVNHVDPKTGQDIVAKLRLSDDVQQASAAIALSENTGAGDSAYADILAIAEGAQLAARLFHRKGKEAAKSALALKFSHPVSQPFFQAFAIAERSADFWQVLVAPHLEAMVLRLPPGSAAVSFDDEYLDDVTIAFAKIVDAKSPYTADHAKRVALFTDMIAEALGLGHDHRRWLRRAAMLHDVGKLAISNSILNKPEKLNPDEWRVLRQHTVLSDGILNRISPLRPIAPIVAAHHERLDGNGYPNGLRGDQVSLEARILTVADVFDALCAERPYKTGMSSSKALDIIEKEVGLAFDADCVNALRQSLDRVELNLAA